MSKVCPLFSGSRGNSTFISSGGASILIDAGRTAKQLENAMRLNNLDISSIKSIFITHEHMDHINGLKVFASRYNLKVFASKGTLKALEEKSILTEKFSCEPIDEKGVEVDGMTIEPFHTSHDSLESFGYVIHTNDNRKVALVTDLGYISDEVYNKILGSDVVIIESNHDIGMLQNGAYPYYLKRRILSEKGHLSNEACSKVLPDLVKSGATRFILAHLSDENNVPQLAYQTALCSLQGCGMKENIDFKVSVAPKENLQGTHVIF